MKKIVVGECGHAHKALLVIADRLLTGDLAVPRESFLTVLRDIVVSGRLSLDPARNDFPVTLHDPCNVVRLMGIVEPQREILRRICPQFREMTPHGVDNYCCGGGSGFAIMSGGSFPDWRAQVSGARSCSRSSTPSPTARRPVGAEVRLRPVQQLQGADPRPPRLPRACGTRHRILYGGLVELVVNAMTDVKPGFIEWEWR